MERLALLLNGALEARYKVGLKMNLPEHKLENLLARAALAAPPDHLAAGRRRLALGGNDH